MFSPSLMIAHRHDEYISHSSRRGCSLTAHFRWCDRRKKTRRALADLVVGLVAGDGYCCGLCDHACASNAAAGEARTHSLAARGDRAAIGQRAASAEDAAGPGTQSAAAGAGRTTEPSGVESERDAPLCQQSTNAAADAAADGSGQRGAAADRSRAPAEHHRPLQRYAAACRSSGCPGLAASEAG